MFKKILSFTVAIVIAIASIAVFASVTTPVVLAQNSTNATGGQNFTIYNTVDGTTANATGNGTHTHKDEIYESVKFYKTNVSIGTNSNANEKSTVASEIKVGYDTNGNWASFLRFPLPDIPANEIITKAELAFVTKYNSTHTGTWNLNAYKDFTDVAFGNTLMFDKTFSVLTDSDKLVGSTPLTLESAGQFTPITVDIKGFVEELVRNDVASVDICLAAPGAENILSLCSGSMKSNNGAGYKPRLIITTEVDPVYGLPAIDTVANEGKTKIRMQSQDNVEFSNTTCGIITGSSAEATYTVNAKTAGKYYFSLYTVDHYAQANNRSGNLIVNDTKIAESYKTAPYAGWNADGVLGTITSRLYQNSFEVDLVKGKNTIKYECKSSHLGLAFVELTNYERAAYTDSRAISEKGIEVPASVQPVVVSYPTEVYKVYDSVSEVPGNRGNITMQVKGNGDVVSSCYYIAATYDKDGYLVDAEVFTLPFYTQTSKNINFGEFNLEGVDSVRIFALDANTLASIAE